MRIITEIVKQFQQNWTEELNAENIARACRDCKMNWINSMLNPVVTIQLFFLQILHDNTACTDVRRLANMKMDVLKCKTVDGVLKQRHVFALVYNVGLQFSAPGDIGSCHASKNPRQSNQFYRRLKVAQVRRPRQRAKRLGRSSASPKPLRTESEKTPTQELQTHDKTTKTNEART